MNIFNILGWIGTVLILLAYFLNSTGRVGGAGRPYQLLNLAGAICMGVSVYHQTAWPAVALQFAWGAIAVYSLLKNKESA